MEKSWIFILILGGTVLLLMNGGESDITYSPEANSGLEIYITDAPADDINYMNTYIEKIEMVGDENTFMINTQSQIRLQEHLVEKIAGEVIPKDNYRYMNIYFNSVATATMKDGSTKQITIQNRVLKVTINERLLDDEVLSLVVDIPLDESVTIEGNEFKFEPKAKLQAQIRNQYREQIREQIRGALHERIQLQQGEQNVESISEKYSRRGR